MMKKNKKILLLKVIASIAFFSVLLSFVRGRELLAIFSRIDWFYFTLSFLMVPVMLVTSCLKWKVLLDAGGHKVSFFRLIAFYLVGYFFSNLLPSTVGGDVVRSFYAGKEINNQSYSAVTVFIERFSGIVFLLILVVLTPLCRPALYGNSYFFIPVLCSLSLLSAVIWVWRVKEPLVLSKAFMSYMFGWLKGISERVQSVLLRKFLVFLEHVFHVFFLRFEKFSHELGMAFQLIHQDRTLLCKLIALTMLFYFLTWLNVYLAFLAFGKRIDFLAMVVLVPTIMFVAHLPVTVLGNLGFFESVFVFYFMSIGVPGAETLAMGLLLRLKMLSLGGVGCVVYLLHQPAWGAVPVPQEEGL
jgi:hypothetical protein